MGRLRYKLRGVNISHVALHISTQYNQLRAHTMASTSNKRKREADIERLYQEMWTEKYFFVSHRNKPVCLICTESMAVMKEYNLKRHFDSKHAQTETGRLTGQLRTDKIATLKKCLGNQQSIFTKGNAGAENATRASFRVSALLNQKMKPFTDGELIKECLITVADIMCPQMKSAFSGIQLSARTVTRRVNDMAANIKLSLQDECGNFEFFSVAIDESTDKTDTAQLAVFVRGITNDFRIVEEMARLVPMKGQTTGEDVLQALLACLAEMNLDMKKLISICTDGAPAMVGVKKGAVTLLENKLKENDIDRPLIKLHCIIHQEALCAKSANMKEIMKLTVKTVNVILSKGLNHRQFQKFLEETEAEYGDLLYYCEVRWLSRGKKQLHVMPILVCTCKDAFFR